MSSALGQTLAAPRTKGRKGRCGRAAEARQHPATMTSYTYDQDEVDYLAAVDQFKLRTGRKFPTCADMLLIAKSIGFARTRTPGVDSVSKVEGR